VWVYKFIWVGCVDDRKSTFGYVFGLGTGAVTRISKKQHAIVLSLVEAEYRGAVKGAREVVWLKRIFSNLRMPQIEPTSLLCDNYHERTKHVDIHYHFIIHFVVDGSIKLQSCPIEDQTADIFTKTLCRGNM
jgi:hypothetical protein